MALPWILIIDDEWGGTSKKQMEERLLVCESLGLSDVSYNRCQTTPKVNPVAEAVFCSGQDLRGENSIDVVLETIEKGWPKLGERGRRWSLVLLDRKFGSNDNFGFDILRAIVKKEAWCDHEKRERNSAIPIILLSKHPYKKGEDSTHVAGASGYIEKSDLVKDRLKKLLQAHGLIEDPSGRVLGVSLPFLQALRKARMAGARGFGNVLLLGETGTGKTYIADYIHGQSRRSARYFFRFSGTSQADPSLLRTELFGYWPGATSTAYSSQAGLAELADKSTLFIDEIGCFDSAGQAELLIYADHPAGQSHRLVRRMGIFPPASNTTNGKKRHDEAIQSLHDRELEGSLIPVDVLLITATNLPLDIEPCRTESHFRHDLYFRLAGTEIKLPPLRQRKEDISMLFKHFLDIAVRESGHKEKLASPEVNLLLESYDWPGNIRELNRIAKETANEAKEWDMVFPHHIPLFRGAQEGFEISLQPRNTVLRETKTPPSKLDTVLFQEETKKHFTLDLLSLPDYFEKLNEVHARQAVACLKMALENNCDPVTKEVLYTRAISFLMQKRLTGQQAADKIIQIVHACPKNIREEICRDPIVGSTYTKVVRLRRKNGVKQGDKK